MAIVDLTTYKKSSANIPVDAIAATGADMLTIVARATITTGNSATSIYRIAEVPSNYVPVAGDVTCAALTGLDDVDLGLYENSENGGAVIGVNALADALDFTSALNPGTAVNAISNVSLANQDAALYTLASDVSSERQTYTLALTINKDCAAGGDVVVKLHLVRREYAAA
jgi:hypothetical protein